MWEPNWGRQVEAGLWWALKSRLRSLKLILCCGWGQLWRVSRGEINLMKVVFQEDWRQNDTWEIWGRDPAVRFCDGRDISMLPLPYWLLWDDFPSSLLISTSAQLLMSPLNSHSSSVLLRDSAQLPLGLWPNSLRPRGAGNMKWSQEFIQPDKHGIRKHQSWKVSQMPTIAAVLKFQYVSPRLLPKIPISGPFPQRLWFSRSQESTILLGTFCYKQ